MSDRLAVLLQYLLPKKALTAFAGWCATSRATGWTRRVIPWFIRRYGVNISQAANHVLGAPPAIEGVTYGADIPGVRIEEIDDPLMQKIRYLDKLVDELAKGRPMEKVLRG